MEIIPNKDNDNHEDEPDSSPHLSDEEIESLDLDDDKTKEYMEQYQLETNKNPIWRELVTEGFKKWL
ncbi:MAG: hypothetical protein ACFFKA_00865, partial [Candidatus Thorarchaeota archaeon]